MSEHSQINACSLGKEWSQLVGCLLCLDMKKRVIAGDERFEMQSRQEDAYVIRDPLTPDVGQLSVEYPVVRPQRVNHHFDNPVPLLDKQHPIKFQQHDSGIDGDLMFGSVRKYPMDYNQSNQRAPADFQSRPNTTDVGSDYLRPDQAVPAPFKLRQSESVIGKHDYEELPTPKPPYPGQGTYNDYLTPVSYTKEQAPSKSLPVPGRPYTNGGFQDSPVKEQPEPPNFRSHPPSFNEPIRKRSNPLYDSVSKKENDKSAEKCGVLSATSCVISVLLLLLLASAALVLAAISISMTLKHTTDSAITSNSSGQDNTVSASQLDFLQSQISGLLLQMQQLNVALDQIKMINSTVATASIIKLISDNNIQQQLITNLTQRISQLESVTSTQTAAINQLNSQYAGQQTQLSQAEVSQQGIQRNLTSQSLQVSDLSAKVIAVSKMPGPPGPAGAGNLSQCYHQIWNKGSPTSFAQTSTQTISIDPIAFVVTGLACTTDVGTQAFYSYDPTNLNTYSCVCRGAINATVANRYCFLHLWICPTNS